MLNEKQREAVEFMEGPALVLAGPGSGKTTVITRRIEALIKNGVDPCKILVITFTKAAAKEMYGRFQNLCPSETEVTFGTFHSVFFHILSREYHYTSADILKASIRNKILKDVLRKQNISLWDEESLEAIFAAISKIKSRGEAVFKLTEEEYFDLSLSSLSCAQFKKVYKSYIDSINSNHLIDFDDMVAKTYELFKEKPETLRVYQNKFEYILIDEFQDINQLQYDVVKLLAAPNNNLFVVGDDDQSIYGFRGAKPSIMLGFAGDYKNTTVINLDTNYRCNKKILDFALTTIKKNKIRFNKDVICGSKSQGGSFEVVQYFDEINEARGVVDRIMKLHKEGVPYDDIAVLYRNHKLAEATKMQLIANNIPARIIRKNTHNKEVLKDILSYIAIALGEGKRADFLNVMNKPDRGILRQALDGDASIEVLKEYYRGDSYVTSKICQWEMLNKNLIKLNASGAVSLIRYGLSYETYLRQNKSYLEETLDKIIENAKAFTSLSAYRKFLIESLENDTGQKSELPNTGVGFYSLHASKGLEFNTVFIIQANDGLLPPRRCQSENAIEEERRLFYVGMTRAKENLIISTTKKTKSQEMAPSRFIEMIKNTSV